MNKKVLLGCGSVFALGLIIFLTICFWLFSGPNGGVKMSNEMNEYALEYLSDHKVLQEDEELVAYYDVTLDMDGSEAAILSTRRVIYHKERGGLAIELNDIEDVKHRKEGLIGDVIEIYSRSGKTMKIEIAPLNGGESFLSALTKLWERSKTQQSSGASDGVPASASPKSE